jgi:hypothetical protein
MPDNLDYRIPQDARRININQKYELEYWSKHLNVTKFKLRLAVQKVGTSSVEAVREWLSRN